MFKSFIIALAGIISLIYLINPSAGIIELIPDNLPLVGNLDEAAAAALLISVLRYFGVDITSIFSKGKVDDEPIDIDKDDYKYKDKDSR